MWTCLLQGCVRPNLICIQKTTYLARWFQPATKTLFVGSSTCLVVDKNKVATRVKMERLAARLISALCDITKGWFPELCSDNHFNYTWIRLIMLYLNMCQAYPEVDKNNVATGIRLEHLQESSVPFVTSPRGDVQNCLLTITSVIINSTYYVIMHNHLSDNALIRF